MANSAVNHSGRRQVHYDEGWIESSIGSQLIRIFLLFDSILQMIINTIDKFLPVWWLPRWVRWRCTSRQELREVDQEILKILSCNHEKRYVPIGNGHSLWSVICNPDSQGTPLVLVHGAEAGLGLWALNLEGLSRHRPVYAFDVLGFGRSSRPVFSSECQAAEDTFVESIENYRKVMRLDKMILLGHGLGGYLCAAYALRYPTHVKHLFLADPWGICSQQSRKLSHLPFLLRIAQKLVDQIKLRGLMYWVRTAGPSGYYLLRYCCTALARSFADKFQDKGLLRKYIYHCNAQKPSGELGYQSLSWQYSWAKQPMVYRLDALCFHIPLTFLYGARSWVNRSSAWVVKNSRAGYVDVKVVRGAGHHLYAERSDLFITVVETIARSVDNNTLPQFDAGLVERIHASPTIARLPPPSSNDDNDLDDENQDGEHFPQNPAPVGFYNLNEPGHLEGGNHLDQSNNPDGSNPPDSSHPGNSNHPDGSKQPDSSLVDHLDLDDFHSFVDSDSTSSLSDYSDSDN